MKFPQTPEERDVYHGHVMRAAERARATLKHGDRIRVTRCGGAAPTFTFAAWTPWLSEALADQPPRWMTSKSGLDDLSPSCVIAVNGVPTSFRDDPVTHLADPFDRTDA